MANRQTYNPYGSNPTGMFIDRFQGVVNDGLGANLPPSAVDYAQNADDRWRGAVKKRHGYAKYLSKGYPINSFSNVFEGFYIQGDDDVWYRTDALLDYRIRPGAGGDPSYPPFTITTHVSYLGSAVATSPDAFTGNPPVGCGSYVASTVNTWRFRHIVQAIDERIADLGSVTVGGIPYTISGLPLETPDASINYLYINQARAFVEALTPNYYQDKASINAGTTVTKLDYVYANYGVLLQLLHIGGNIGTFEWSNINSSGVVVYRNDMIASDLLTDLMYFELETALFGLRYQFALSTTYTMPTGTVTGVDLSDTPWYFTGTCIPVAGAGRFPAVWDNNGVALGNQVPFDPMAIIPSVYWAGTVGGIEYLNDMIVTSKVLENTGQLTRVNSCTLRGDSLFLHTSPYVGVMYLYKHTTKAYVADASLGRRAYA